MSDSLGLELQSAIYCEVKPTGRADDFRKFPAHDVKIEREKNKIPMSMIQSYDYPTTDFLSSLAINWVWVRSRV